MSRPLTRAVAAALLPALAAALLLGCAGDRGDTGDARPAAGSPSAPARSSGAEERKREGEQGRPDTKSADGAHGTHGTDGKDGGQEGERGQRDRERAAPTVPDSELTPATGTFTRKEKNYLKGRVPEGLEPAAVLEAGRTACARIRTTAEVSRQGVVRALRSGEIDQAEPAVTHLCPQFAPLLRAAGKGD
ncbi:hypothetical protein [Streptomyces boncukensis]|uniref:DUF732 domain-containing protein n=1 Tax=Streptomyces boncukensis TaxID=2711219 RepID=A0A6G4X4C6_9ACTN|nr:hypothetical protein [Streptomyces boncukensis]NGO71982.1 hypothetical protein [Streptomyces boncukensis]